MCAQAHFFSKRRGGGAGSLVLGMNDQSSCPDPKPQEGTCAIPAAGLWEEALTASTSRLLAQLPAQQLGVLLRSTGTPLSPLCLTLWLTCRSANPLACCPTELMKETSFSLVGGIRIRDLLMSYSKGGCTWPSTSKAQSRVRSGNISLTKHLQNQRPVRTRFAVLLRSPSAQKGLLLPLISTQLWLDSEGRQLGTGVTRKTIWCCSTSGWSGSQCGCKQQCCWLHSCMQWFAFCQWVLERGEK